MTRCVLFLVFQFQFFERDDSLRNSLILAALVVIVMVSSEAQAARRVLGGRQTVSSGDRPLGRLMEFERRKNASLRSMFGR